MDAHKVNSKSTCLGSWSLFLFLEQRQEGNIRHFDDFESDAGNISDGVTGSTESSDQDFVVLLDVVQTTVLRYKSRDFLSVFDELHPHALSDSGVGLLSLDADFLQNDAFDVRSPAERIGFQGRAGMSFLVVLVRPPLHAAMGADLSSGFQSTRFAHFCLLL